MFAWLSTHAWGLAVGFSTALTFVAAFLVLERFAPVESDQSPRRVLFNVQSGLLTEVMTIAVAPLAALLPGYILSKTGTGWIDLGLGNPQTLTQRVLAVICYLFVYDVSQYWWHRLQHAHWFFWASHRLHHSDEAFNASTALRRHWIESFTSPFIASIPPAVLFAPFGRDGLAIYIFLTAIGYWNHANLRVSLGPWFVSPMYHRLHHSALPEHDGKNLAGVFPILDVMFGTYCKPSRDAHPTGLYNGERDIGVVRSHLAVFRLWRDGWRRLQRHPLGVAGRHLS